MVCIENKNMNYKNMNYFTNQKIRWQNWSPDKIIFKKNNIVSKLLPEENLLSYKSKTDRDEKICGIKGGLNRYPTLLRPANNNNVYVQIVDLKKDFPTANIDFCDFSSRKFSDGSSKSNVNALIYIASNHQQIDWQKDKNGNWASIPKGVPLPDLEGYRIAYGGQGGDNPFHYDEFMEIIDISQAVINFLCDRLIPLKKGLLNKQELAMV